MEMWYYVRNGVQTGPIRFEELQAAVARGQLAATDLVWKEGTSDWVAANTVDGLFESLPVDAMPVPPGPPAVPEAAKPKRRQSLESIDKDLEAPPGGDSVWKDLVARAKEFFGRATAANPAAIVPNADEDARLTRAGVTDPMARRLAVWRRAVLWIAFVPTAFCAFFGLINTFAMDTDDLSGFGVFIVYLDALALFALPVTAVLAANAYDKPRESTRWLLIGAAVSAGFPLLTAFIPAAAFFDMGGSATSEARAMLGFGAGVMFYMILMPTVLSLLPAASRACIRLKTFIPQSLVPGWGLVASVPLFVLLTLASVVLLYQLVGNFLLILGLGLWIGAPLLYLNQFSLLTRPVTDTRDLDALSKSHVAVFATAAAGVVLLIIYLFTAKFMDQTLLGFSSSDSVLQPWSLDLHKKWMEFVGRSLFMTVLFADLLVRMTLSVWREDRAFVGTPAAVEFDKSMASLSEAVRGKPKAKSTSDE